MSPGTAIYRALSRLVAGGLGGIDSVRSVHARRSVATGEVVFGRSDVDLHLIVAAPASTDAESELLCAIAARLRRLKLLVPCLGHVDVSTREELERWYAEQPYQWHRDRGWLCLYGEPFERPRRELDGAGRARMLWWFSWAGQLFARSFRAGDARTCCNLFLDMFDVVRLASGLSEEPLSRAGLLELWARTAPPSEGRSEILRAYGRGFRGHRGGALVPLYQETLGLQNQLADHVEARLEGSAMDTLTSRVAPTFVPRTYRVVDANDRREVAHALENATRADGVWVVTDAGLKLHLLYGNPWEYATLRSVDGALELSEPPPEAFAEAVSRRAYREYPRHFGLRAEHALLGPLYAQCRLYASDQFVASDAAALRDAYRDRYGTDLDTGGTRTEFFRSGYRAVCEIIDETRSHRDR